MDIRNLAILFVAIIAFASSANAIPYTEHISIQVNTNKWIVQIDDRTIQVNTNIYEEYCAGGWHTVNVNADGFKPYSMKFYCGWLYEMHYIALEKIPVTSRLVPADRIVDRTLNMATSKGASYNIIEIDLINNGKVWYALTAEGLDSGLKVIFRPDSNSWTVTDPETGMIYYFGQTDKSRIGANHWHFDQVDKGTQSMTYYYDKKTDNNGQESISLLKIGFDDSVNRSEMQIENFLLDSTEDPKVMIFDTDTGGNLVLAPYNQEQMPLITKKFADFFWTYTPIAAEFGVGRMIVPGGVKKYVVKFLGKKKVNLPAGIETVALSEEQIAKVADLSRKYMAAMDSERTIIVNDLLKVLKEEFPNLANREITFVGEINRGVVSDVRIAQFEDNVITGKPWGDNTFNMEDLVFQVDYINIETIGRLEGTLARMSRNVKDLQRIKNGEPVTFSQYQLNGIQAQAIKQVEVARNTLNADEIKSATETVWKADNWEQVQQATEPLPLEEALNTQKWINYLLEYLLYIKELRAAAL